MRTAFKCFLSSSGRLKGSGIRQSSKRKIRNIANKDHLFHRSNELKTGLPLRQTMTNTSYITIKHERIANDRKSKTFFYHDEIY